MNEADEIRIKQIVNEMRFWGGKYEIAIDELAMIQPGTSRIMPEIGEKTWKLYYAGEATNWPLAKYYWKECKKLFELVSVTRPKHEDAIDEYLRDSWAPIESAIKDENWDSFKKAFDQCVDDANAWHEKKDKGYIRWKLPEMPPPDVDFEPRR